MAKNEAWLAPHEESTAELGPIRFAERMPPKYRWLWISGGAAVIFILLGLVVYVGSTSQPLPPGDVPQGKKAAAERSVAKVMFIASAVLGLCFIAGGYAIYRSFMTGSYSLHEQGAMSIVWGRTARLRYQDVDELTVRSQRVFVNGAYIGAAQWVTLGSTTVDAPPFGSATLRTARLGAATMRPSRRRWSRTYAAVSPRRSSNGSKPRWPGARRTR
jgi:hypothetical protein